jgi:peptidoglycan-associated lipoprotein
MLKQYSAVVLTCFGFSLACGGSNSEANSPVEASAEAEFQASAEPEKYSPNAPDPNSTQLTVDAALMERCGIKSAKIYFPYDSAEVKANSDESVRSMADCLVSGNLKGKELIVVGHTDPRGTAEYNKELGKSRAEAIADLLIAEGLPKEKVVIKSAGESGASEDKDEWPSDRRVAVAVVAD